MSTAKEEYLRLLRHPRWQKRRLEIFQRDDWQCQNCHRGLDNGIEFHVHHRRYTGNPWQAPDEDLSTMCALCHEEEHGPPGLGRQELDARCAFLKDKLGAATREVSKVLEEAAELREKMAR